MTYENNTQLYIIFEKCNFGATVILLQNCLNDIKTQCTANKLVLNDDKTKLLLNAF